MESGIVGHLSEVSLVAFYILSNLYDFDA